MGTRRTSARLKTRNVVLGRTALKDAVTVRVWDLPIRLFHWVLVALVAAQVVTGLAGWLDWHLILGPAVLALMLFRLAWGLAGSTTARFSHFVVRPAAVRAYLANRHAGVPWPGVGHNPLGALSVIALLAMVAAQTVTGLFTSDDILTDGPLVSLASSAAVKLATKLHHRGLLALAMLVGLHVAAILYYRLADRDDLVTPMLTGVKTIPASWRPTLVFVGTGRAVALAVASAALVWGGLAWLAG
jgi:cytochrome b